MKRGDLTKRKQMFNKLSNYFGKINKTVYEKRRVLDYFKKRFLTVL